MNILYKNVLAHFFSWICCIFFTFIQYHRIITIGGNKSFAVFTIWSMSFHYVFTLFTLSLFVCLFFSLFTVNIFWCTWWLNLIDDQTFCLHCTVMNRPFKAFVVFMEQNEVGEKNRIKWWFVEQRKTRYHLVSDCSINNPIKSSSTDLYWQLFFNWVD